MSCRDLERHLDAYLEGSLVETERLRLEGHLTSCAACYELAEIAAGSGEAAPEGRSPELCSAILAGTSGAPCGLPYGDLCARADGTLNAAEHERVRLHLALCDECHGLATALGRLAEELPALQVPQMRLPLEFRLTLGFARALVRAAEIWKVLVARPRFALEVAYVGTLVLAILFVLPGSPLRAASSGALTLAQTNPVTTLSTPLGNVKESAAEIWHRVSEPTSAVFARMGDGLEDRYQGTRQAASQMKRHGADLGEAALELDLAEGREALKGLGSDAGSLWQALFGGTGDRETTTLEEEKP